jgi:thiol-disulfide isomerase/thioredoxin
MIGIVLLVALCLACGQRGTEPGPAATVTAPASDSGATAPDTARSAMGPMPSWKVVDSKGQEVSSEALKGKVLLIDFWASWCPPCRQEIPGFIQLQEKYRGRGLQVVGFSMDRTPEAHSRFVEEQKFNYPSSYASTDEGQALVAAFEKVIGKIEGIPTTVLVDRQGNIVSVHVGAESMEVFEKELQPLLK